MKLNYWILSILFIAILFGLVGSLGFATNKGHNELVSIKINEQPKLDGEVDKVWDSAPETIIHVTGGRSGDSTVKMKSLYTDSEVYFLAVWEDDSEDLDRKPWEFDGEKWNRLPGGGA